MHPVLRVSLLTCAMLSPVPALHAGGSHYGTAPGAAADFKGTVSEWPVPTPEFARDPAIAPDGSIFIAVMRGNRIARFDPATRKFTEWDLPPRAHPHGVLVDLQGIVWYTGNGNGTIGRLDTASGRITEYRAPGGPYGLALDRAGNVWVCLMRGNQLGRIDAKSGAVSTVDMPPGSRPRRMAAAPDGSLWVTFYGTNKLVQFDPEARKVLREIALPAADSGDAYTVTGDGAGVVWVNEIHTNTVVRFDPATGTPRLPKLPSSNVSLRTMAVDAQGRLRYVHGHSGRLGMVQ